MNPNANRRYLVVALALLGLFMVAEVVVAVVSGSLAPLSDAGHMLSDVGAIGASLWAMRLAARPAAGAWTFGWKRAEILSAAGNGITLLVISAHVVIDDACFNDGHAPNCWTSCRPAWAVTSTSHLPARTSQPRRSRATHPPLTLAVVVRPLVRRCSTSSDDVWRATWTSNTGTFRLEPTGPRQRPMQGWSPAADYVRFVWSSGGVSRGRPRRYPAPTMVCTMRG